MSLDQIPAWVAYVAALILLFSPLVFALQKPAHAWLEHSLTTATPHDDRVARVLVKVVDVLCALVLALPRITMNLGKLLDLLKAARNISRPPSSLLPLVLVPLLAANITACGGTQMSRARTVLAVSGQAVVAVERTFAPAYADATERAREESETFEEYSEAIRRWNAGANAILIAAASLRVAESSLDAIDEGLAGDIAGVLACAGVALVDVVVALDGLVDIPDALRTAVSLVGALAGPLCTPPDPGEVASIIGVPPAEELAVAP